MTQLLEDRLDQILDMRGQHRLQQEAEQAPADRRHADPERDRTKFASDIHTLIRETFRQANRHLAGRPEHYAFREASQNFVAPLRAGRMPCHPIAYELCGDGRKLGKTLVVELTDDGSVQASLLPKSPDLAVPRTRIDLGWRPIQLAAFSEATASDLVVWFLAAIVSSFSLAQQH